MQPLEIAPQLIHLALAFLLGLLVGSERGWHERDFQEGGRFAGIRTFSLIGLLGGVVAVASQQWLPNWTLLILAITFLPLGALLISAHHFSATVHHDYGLTTIIAAMLVYWLGALPALGLPLVASSTAVVIALVLHLKGPMHQLLVRLQGKELMGALQFLVISVIMLPLLPDKGYGPWQAINPYKIWWMVVLISGLSLLAYFAIHWSTARRGILLTSLFGGLISSTAVTLTLAKMAPSLQRPRILATGILLACGMMFLRVLVLVALFAPSILPTLTPGMLSAAAILLVGASWFWRQHREMSGTVELGLRNPFELTPALKFGLLLTLILLGAQALQHWYGDRGLYLLAVLSGLTDVDAITLALSHQVSGGLSEHAAALGIILAAATNTLVKGGLAWYAGGSQLGGYVNSVLLTAVIVAGLLGWLGL